MIQHLKHHQINFEKYDACVRASDAPTIYANSWYLDIVTGKDWEALVSGDYEMVLPIPYARPMRMLFMRKIMQPYFCQQLGLFDQSNTDDELRKRMIEELSKLTPTSYHFNFSNNHLLTGVDKFLFRSNYILPLNKDFEEIEKGFSKNVLRNIRKAEKANLRIEAMNYAGISDFIQAKVNVSQLKLPQKIYTRMNLLMTEVLIRESGVLYGVYDGDTFVAGAFFIKSYNRLIYLLATRTKVAEKNGAAHFLISSVIEKYNEIFDYIDFEGSEHDGVARFFHSFGSINEGYFAYKG